MLLDKVVWVGEELASGAGHGGTGMRHPQSEGVLVFQWVAFLESNYLGLLLVPSIATRYPPLCLTSYPFD